MSKLADEHEQGNSPYTLDVVTESFPDFSFLEICWRSDCGARPTMVEVCAMMSVELFPGIPV